MSSLVINIFKSKGLLYFNIIFLAIILKIFLELRIIEFSVLNLSCYFQNKLSQNLEMMRIDL